MHYIILRQKNVTQKKCSFLKFKLCPTVSKKSILLDLPISRVFLTPQLNELGHPLVVVKYNKKMY